MDSKASFRPVYLVLDPQLGGEGPVMDFRVWGCGIVTYRKWAKLGEKYHSWGHFGSRIGI